MSKGRGLPMPNRQACQWHSGERSAGSRSAGGGTCCQIPPEAIPSTLQLKTPGLSTEKAQYWIYYARPQGWKLDTLYKLTYFKRFLFA
ncbi:hypothetical protein Y1Q_0022057 [Alligator mississippiensis]|uniref:Uncharacterized protein n=1 Tax=Alligator mississippiensis TaxID=8496 RepID=A0A151NLW3_ALLMI|nr:hypothetical protein Y1Q_0022057 [Alligator mississippiensis]